MSILCSLELNIFLPNLFGVFLYLVLESLRILHSDLSELWERFAAMLILLETQLFAVLLQHTGASKTSLAVNHTFEMCKTALQWLHVRKNTTCLSQFEV